MIAKFRLFGFCCATTISFSITPALAAQAVPTKDSYTAYITALSALTAAANTAIQGERNTARLLWIRKTLTTKLLATLPLKEQAADLDKSQQTEVDKPPQTDPNKTWSLGDALDEIVLLCHFRSENVPVVAAGELSKRDREASITVNHLLTVAQENYLNLVIAQLQAITPSNASDIPSAIKALFTSYQVNAPDASLQPAAVQKVVKQVEDSCEDDFKEFDAAYYGTKIEQPGSPTKKAFPLATVTGLPSLSFLGPIGALFDTATGILAPVFVGLSNFIVAAEQRKAIHDFLSVPATQNSLRDNGVAVARNTSDYALAQRLALAGSFAEQIALIRDIKIDLTKISSCTKPADQIFDRAKSGIPSQSFISCYHAIWAQLDDAVNNVLKTASSYDQIADAGDTNTVLKNYEKITTPSNFAIIANSRDVVAKDNYWQEINDLITFAGVVSNAFSKSNETKFRQALDAALK